MLPIVTPDEMTTIDRLAPAPVDDLIERAGRAVARVAVEMLGGTYGRRVVIIEGKGNNGNDGRAAARYLRAKGVRVVEIDAGALDGPALPECDLVIDAAYGTGFRGTYHAPTPRPGTPVLAVDIPSGVSGLTGETSGHVLAADRTVTFGATKPGLVLTPGRNLAGAVEVADIGLDVSGARAHVIEAADVARWWPVRPVQAHKWQAAVWVVAGTPGMAGSARLACGGAQRAGAGYVRLSTPGGLGEAAAALPAEVVRVDVEGRGWAPAVLEGLHRFQSLVIGNGLGVGDDNAAEIRRVVEQTEIPMVVDADALTALGLHARDRFGPTAVVTPHDGEYERVMGHLPAADRLAAARALSADTGAVAVLKGPTTVVAHPDGRVLVSTQGDARLATAGTGDVLAGVIGALLAQGTDPFEAAAAGAYVHAAAGDLGWRLGLVAGDLVGLLPPLIDRLTSLRS